MSQVIKSLPRAYHLSITIVCINIQDELKHHLPDALPDMTVPPDQSRHQICRSHLSRPCYPHFGCWRGIRRRDYLAHKRGNIADTNTHNQQPSSRSRRGLCIAWLAVERALFHDLGRLLGCELFIVSRFMHSSGVRLCSQCSSDNTGATSARRAWWGSAPESHNRNAGPNVTATSPLGRKEFPNSVLRVHCCEQYTTPFLTSFFIFCLCLIYLSSATYPWWLYCYFLDAYEK